MNDGQTTLFLGYDLLEASVLVFLVDLPTRTFWYRVMPYEDYAGLTEILRRKIAGLRVVEFGTPPDPECPPFLPGMSCANLTKSYDLRDYAGYIRLSRMPVAATGMRAVMWQSGSRLFNDTFVVNTETGDYWSGNVITTALKELNMTLTGARRSPRFQNYIHRYPILLKDGLGDDYVVVFKDEVGAIMHFHAETDRLIRELKLKEIDNKAEKMTLAEFLERYCNKENEK